MRNMSIVTRPHRSRSLLPLLLLLLLHQCHETVPLMCAGPPPCTDSRLERRLAREFGDSVTLRCRFAGLSQREAKSLRWYGPRSPSIPLTIGGDKFSLDKRLHLDRGSVGQYLEWSLTIDFLKFSDSGEYRCVFNNDKPAFTVQLNVTDPELAIVRDGSYIFVSASPQVRLGGPAVLECRANRTETQDVDLNWDRAIRQTKQVEAITRPDGGRELRISSWHRIDNATLADGGAHTCVETLIHTGQVLGKATVMLKIRLSRKERIFMESTTRRPQPTQRPPPPPPPPQQQPWQDIWQQQQQSQPQPPNQKPTHHRGGSKVEGVILNDAGLTSSERQRPASSQPDFTYSVPDQNNNKFSPRQCELNSWIITALSVVVTVLGWNCNR